MELWIRSQDKELFLKPICFEIDEEGKNKFLIVTKVAQNYNDICVGMYKSKERALEVLDEIQKIFEPKILLDSKTIKQENLYEQNGVIYADYNVDARFEQLNTVVYEMPTE